ncbi:MAG: hypothetical protein A2086_07485 [Spirochaetes bacterium GWD1_27_9]|nr:MAG: hypothetical protein A2Z98_18130 [Spirochaetes bacterium GWB1_27_13]OHD27949.1 MAG: hypothetical protein A2Y34_13320 [Spirochaetes bacterium GWC1_27_15]OHD44775.1 MAG: hypothetical protein A2086_07485 [Spirochaetes bacterium GWD1_27_9]
MDFIAGFFQLFGSLGIFLFGIRIMSDGIQKVAGEKFQTLLNILTFNRFTAVFTGLTITSIIQSSSATTVILVSLVNAGLMTLPKAIGVIMGANIGTTMTAWIVSLIGFKFSISMFAMPAIAIALPLIFSKKEKLRNLGEFFIGFGLLFLGLDFLKKSVPDIKSNVEAIQFLTNLTGYGHFSVILFIIIGTLLTVTVQSSSAAMAITMTMAYKGWINFDIAAALCLGENIGTTITAHLASIGMNVSARRAARAHMFFNLFGVIWMIFVFYPFIKMIDFFIPGNVNDPSNIPMHLSMFHTTFNLINTTILIWFIPQFAKIVEFLIPEKKEAVDRGYHLQITNTNFVDFADTNLRIARNEIGKISTMTYDMLLYFLNAIKNDKKEEVNQIEEKIQNYDTQIDIMYIEISKFLANCRTRIINDKDSFTINSMLIIVSELKSISNSCTLLIESIKKKEKKKMKFHKNAKNEIEDYTAEVLDFVKYNSDFINNNMKEHDYNLAQKMEKAIDAKRDRLRKTSQNKMIKGADIQAELIYMDILKYLEHIGDFNLTISHSLKEI